MIDFNTDMLKAIQTRSLSSVICDQLEDTILSGKIKPGERINESQLANLLGVSRAPIREACRQLEKHGVVEVKVNRGTFVKEIDLEEVEELYDIRAALDALAGERAAECINTEDFNELDQYIKDMENAVEVNDTQVYFKVNLNFHMCIVRISGNQNLFSIYDGICKKTSLFRRTSLSLPGRLPISLKHHQDITDALKAKNARKTAQLLRKHIMEAKDALVASFR